MSMFDADNFISQTVEGENSTSRKPIPEHDATVVVEEVTIKSGAISKGERRGETWAGIQLKMIVDSDVAREATNMDEPRLFHMIFLDLTDDGLLDMSEGANVGLGKFRRAVGQNSGEWSPSMLEGATCVASIGIKEDDRDPEALQNYCKAFAEL